MQASRLAMTCVLFGHGLKQVNFDRADGVAVPVFGPSGMEDLGLIKYRETSLLLKEGMTPAPTRESITSLVGREVGHQVNWFTFDSFL